MLPPGVVPAFDDNTVDVQAAILSYSMIRDYEEKKWDAALAGAKC